MGSFKDRRSNRLIGSKNQVRLLVIFVGLFLALIWQKWGQMESSEEGLTAKTFASPVEAASEAQDSSARQEPSAPLPDRQPSTLSQNQKELIESMFRQLQDSPEKRDQILRQLRRTLQKTFQGQEDCWSCEGTIYFDRFDQIAGRGESRKPISLKDWILKGDEAYDERELDEARQYYTEAMQIVDERVFQPEEEIDTSSLERLQNRCAELECR